MKKVLITGAGSYIGTHLKEALSGLDGAFDVGVLDVKDPAWQQADLSGVDAVVHVAGVAHQKETEKNADLYYRVNRDLSVQVAEKAKAAGIKQFVFFSSMSVYGVTCGHITAETPLAPVTHYGKSKRMAEEKIVSLADAGFQVAVLRPPMVYGKGCRGNYPRLSALVRKLPVFPKAGNQRSMIYIDCLCAFVRRLVESGQGGLYFPQNKEYVSTDELARAVALVHGKGLWQPGGFQWLLRLLAPRVGLIGKVFGSLTYDRAMSAAFDDEPQPDFAETIRRTEGAA